LSGDESARIYLWDTRTGKKVREFPRTKGHTRGIQAIAVSPNDRQFATVGKDDVIKVWNMAGGDPIKTIEGKGANFYGISYLPNGSFATGTLAEGARLYTNKFDLAAKFTVDQGANDLALNSSGSMGVTANRNGSVTLWNIAKREKVATMPGHSDWVLGVAIAPNGKVAASSSTDSSVVLWDLKSYKKIATITERAYVDSLVAFTSDGKYLLTTDAGNALQVYQVSPAQK
jgi:WD40 repeat protein